MKAIISRTLTLLLVLCAVTMTGLAVYHQFDSPSLAERFKVVESWRAIAAQGHLEGSRDAPVKIIEFYDYQCPYCRQLQPVLETIQARYPDQVAIVYRHFPLDRHPLAHSAALAVTCAADQNRFASFHHLLFENLDWVEHRKWESMAQAIGIADLEAFSECVAQQRTAAVIDADVRTAEEIGIRGTPTLLINGVVVSGALSTETLDALVQRVIQEG